MNSKAKAFCSTLWGPESRAGLWGWLGTGRHPWDVPFMAYPCPVCNILPIQSDNWSTRKCGFGALWGYGGSQGKRVPS